VASAAQHRLESQAPVAVVASKSSEGFAGTSPPAGYAKTATESRLTFLIHCAKLGIVFVLLKALLGALRAAINRVQISSLKPGASPTARSSASCNASATATSD